MCKSGLIDDAAYMLLLLRGRKMLIRKLRMFLFMICVHAVMLLMTMTCPVSESLVWLHQTKGCQCGIKTLKETE